MMKRREFITLLGGAAATPAMLWPFAARAQQPERMRRIGVLMSYGDNDPEAAARVGAFESGLQKFRWTKDRNIRIDYRLGLTNADRIRPSVEDLIRLRCDVILAHTPATLAALQQATRTIPIVFVQSSDPIELGLVTSLARPEANITGFVAFEPSLGGKWLQMLTDVAPQLKQVLVIQGRENPSSAGYMRSIEAAAPLLGVALSTSVVNDAEEIERSIAVLAGTLNAGLLVLPSPIAGLEQEKIVASAARYRAPAVYPFKQFVAAGGLMFYGAGNIVDQWRQAASYVDRILTGTQPRDLPVQLPTKFELVVNLRTAKSLGLTIPRDFLLIADEVIE